MVRSRPVQSSQSEVSQVGRKRCNLLVTGGGGALLLFVYGVLRDERVRQIKKGTEKETFHPKCETSCVE